MPLRLYEVTTRVNGKRKVVKVRAHSLSEARETVLKQYGSYDAVRRGNRKA